MNIAGCASALLVPNSEVLGVHLIFPRGPYRDESKWNLPHSGQSLWCPGSLLTSGNEPPLQIGLRILRHFISDSLVFFPLHDFKQSDSIHCLGGGRLYDLYQTNRRNRKYSSHIHVARPFPRLYWLLLYLCDKLHSLKKEIMINLSSLMGRSFASETVL